MPESPLEQNAADCDSAAEELERAARHLRVAAQHFRDKEVPRACAHTLAAQGHAENAADALRAVARRHAERAIPQG